MPFTPLTGNGAGDIYDGTEPLAPFGYQTAELIRQNFDYLYAARANQDFVAPIDGDFAWVNQGAASIVATTIQGAPGLYLSIAAEAATTNLRLRAKSTPATPWGVRFRFIPGTLAESFNCCGLFFRESGSGKIHTFSLDYVTTVPELRTLKYTNATTFSAGYNTARYGHSPAVYGLQIEDNGTNRVCSMLADGKNPLVIHSVGRTDFLTANQFGFYIQGANATWGCGMTVLSWQEF